MFYQRNFGNEAGLLWVYDRQGSTLKELHPRVICYEKDLYSVKPENKPPDTQVESKLLGAVDGLGCWPFSWLFNTAECRLSAGISERHIQRLSKS
jgi:hypothetical protein